jgi:hypothetical protein
MSTREVAAALGLTIGALQQLIFRGIIRPAARRLGPSYVWDGVEVENARISLMQWRERRNRSKPGTKPGALQAS